MKKKKIKTSSVNNIHEVAKFPLQMGLTNRAEKLQKAKKNKKIDQNYKDNYERKYKERNRNAEAKGKHGRTVNHVAQTRC